MITAYQLILTAHSDAVVFRFQHGTIRERMVHLLEIFRAALRVMSWRLTLIVSCIIIIYMMISNCIVIRLLSGPAGFVVIVQNG